MYVCVHVSPLELVLSPDPPCRLLLSIPVPLLLVPLPSPLMPQVNGQSMVDVTHEDAVAILKATQDSVTLQVERNAIAHIGLVDDEVRTQGARTGPGE